MAKNDLKLLKLVSIPLWLKMRAKKHRPMKRRNNWLKEVIGVKYYFRYCDDMVILSDKKEDLHRILSQIREYLENELKLTVKGNYQIFPVEKRGIDFVGYKFFHTHTLLRKSIKKSFARAIARRKGPESIAAYTGWAKHANSLHLVKKLLNDSNTKLQGFRDKIGLQGIGR